MEFLGLECRDTLPQILFGNDRGAAKARQMLLRKTSPWRTHCVSRQWKFSRQLMDHKNKRLQKPSERLNMLNAENEKDKERFERLKQTEVERGRDEDKATDVAAKEVKELRRREGRTKEDAL